MKKSLLSFVAALTLGTASVASTLAYPTNIDDEFIQMQRFFNNVLNSEFINQPLSKFQNINYPKVDIKEFDNRYVLKFELAGMDKKDIKLSIKNTTLVLEGNRKINKEDKSNNYIRHEIFMGSFKRIIQLPDNIMIDNATNKFDNGILTITIPKKKITKSNYKILKIN